MLWPLLQQTAEQGSAAQDGLSEEHYGNRNLHFVVHHRNRGTRKLSKGHWLSRHDLFVLNVTSAVFFGVVKILHRRNRLLMVFFYVSLCTAWLGGKGQWESNGKSGQESSGCCRVLRHGCDWDICSLHLELFFSTNVMAHVHDRRWWVRCWWGLDWQGLEGSWKPAAGGGLHAAGLAAPAHFPNLCTQVLDLRASRSTHLLVYWSFSLTPRSPGCRRPFLSPGQCRDSFQHSPSLSCRLPCQSFACIFSNIRCYTILINAMMLLDILRAGLLPFPITFFSPVRCICLCLFLALNSPTRKKKKKRKISYPGNLLFFFFFLLLRPWATRVSD